MTTIASRDLRNHTRQVLQQVADGTTVTITVNGEPVAELTPVSGARPAFIHRAELSRLLASHQADRTLAADMDWISADTTEDLGPIR